MKKLLTLAAAALALSATVASAQTLPGGSIHIMWDDCYAAGGGGGAVNKTFACNSNAGASFTAYASVVPPSGLTQYVGHIAVLDLQSATPALPDWWKIGATTPPACRVASALGAAPAAGATTCLDLTDNTQFGGIDYNFSASPNRARLRTAYAMDAGLAGPVADTDELTVLAISINRSRTVLQGAIQPCTGCSTPVCLVFNSLLLDQVDPNLPRGLVSSGEQQFVTWQGSSAQVPCPGATPTQNKTWGQVKSLYR